MKPTIKDLAKTAGVSLATIDRVLNNRPGVAKKTQEAVNHAVEELGYQRNYAAAALSRNKYLKFLFALPSRGSDFVRQIENSIHEMEASGYGGMSRNDLIYIDENNPHEVAMVVGGLSKSNCDGLAIMAIEHPEIRDSITRLKERGVPVISLVSNQVSNGISDFVGIPNFAAGQTAGRLMLRFQTSSSGAIAVVTNTISSNDSLERRRGLDSVFSTQSAHLILPTTEHFNSSGRAQDIVRKLLKARPDLTGIYIMGSEARLPLEALSRYARDCNLVVVAHELTNLTKRALEDGRIDALIAQDTGHLVRSCVRKLKAICEQRPTLFSQEKVRIEILIKENMYE
jgi:LacI family transcriptional regulator